MTKNTIVLLFIVGVLLFGCSTKDYFGKLAEKEIIEFQLEEQTSTTRIEGDTIFIKVSSNANLYELSATEIKVSDYATVKPGIGEKQDFSEPVSYTVTAENGTTHIYYVIVQLDVSMAAQLPNSSFDLWYDAVSQGQNYKEIGLNEKDKTWGTGNQGAAFAIRMGSKADFPSSPYDRDGKMAARLTTQNMGQLASIAGKGIAAGNLFVGSFKFENITVAYPVFGYPYTQLPKAFQVDYQYRPKAGLLDGKLKPVDGNDALDFYLILEKRFGDKVTRLGVGWFRSDEEQTDWKTKKIDIKYAHGKAPDGVEEYATKILKYGVDGNSNIKDPKLMGDATWGDISKENPTHILVVFTSSYQGDYFIGAPGSELLVDNFELIYE